MKNLKDIIKKHVLQNREIELIDYVNLILLDRIASDGEINTVMKNYEYLTFDEKVNRLYNYISC